MVQAVENWTELHGRAVAVEPGPGTDRVTLRVGVERAESVAGFPNLLEGREGTEVAVEAVLEPGDPSIRPGDAVRFRARMVGPERYMVQPGSLAVG